MIIFNLFNLCQGYIPNSFTYNFYSRNGIEILLGVISPVVSVLGILDYYFYYYYYNCNNWGKNKEKQPQEKKYKNTTIKNKK